LDVQFSAGLTGDIFGGEFNHFVKNILRKEYSVENSLFLGEYLAKKGKRIARMAKLPTI